MPPISDLRESVDHLHRIASGDLDRIWRRVTNAVQAREALKTILPSLIEAYGSAAATVAADWYDEMRAELQVRGRFSAIPAPISEPGAETLARWGVGPLFDSNPDWRRARMLIDGGLQRRIANVARETIQLSSVEDPRAAGWQRQAAGGCVFCRMLAGRGAVYSQLSADFASHDHCRCVAVPAFEGRPRIVKPYTPTDRVVSDADRQRVRAWLAEHGDQ